MTTMLFFIPFSSFEKNSLNMYNVAYIPQGKEIARRLKKQEALYLELWV